MDTKKTGKVLVIGAGIAGINAALKLAESGTGVYLCEREPNIGGTLFQLDRWFPDNHCGLCQDLMAFNKDDSSRYCLRQGLFHPNITVLLNSEVEKVEGEAGGFSVILKTRSTGVKKDLCTGCGLCEQVCPIESGAISLNRPLSLHKLYAIDKKSCTKCGICVQKCPSGAIDLNMADETCQIEVSSIILSTGFEEFDPLPATEFGYKRYPNVITSIELERLLGGSGHSYGLPARPSDGKLPRSVAFIQCVGSRTHKRDYCSATCCMQAIKEAMMLKEARPETDIEIYYMDIRDFGKGYYEYHQQACEKYGIKFTRGRIPAIKQDFRTKDLLITSIGEDHKIVTRRSDMVVLSVGQTPSPDFRDLCRRLGVDTNKWGFCTTGRLNPVETNRKGVYVCGSASGPKDIADTLVESTAAAGQAAAPDNLKPSDMCAPLVNDEEPKAAIFICNCGKQISEVLNIEGLAAFSKRLPEVVHVEVVSALCHQETPRSLEYLLKGSGADRVIIAACSGLRAGEFSIKLPVEMVDIREQLAWVHRNESQAATEKAKIMVLMALEKLNRREDIPPHFESVIPRALVVGGGLAGLTAALNIAEKGFEVELLEKSSRLGGNSRYVYSSLDGEQPSEYIQQLIRKVESNRLIRLRLETELVKLSGYSGNFKCTFRGKNTETDDTAAGAVIVATGAEEFRPDEYLYGQTDRVITQREMEERLNSKNIHPNNLKSVVMIQCVGSRCNERPFCSRICCSQALKNALLLKQHNPKMNIAIFYRDLMAYGFKEEYYTLARDKGILFFQYDLENKPNVITDGKEFRLLAVDPVLGEKMDMKPDLVVLSTGVVPSNNAELARVLDVELTAAGFFKEAEVKFRPVDLLKEGVFVCGLAHSPRDITETIAQAQAAAQRVVSLLSQQIIKSSRIISLVDERRCSGCELCIKACPYGARVKDLEKGVAQVIGHLCQGCGTCVSACPNGAARLGEFNPKQIFSMLDAAL